MATSSVIAEKGWKSRTSNNKMNSILTASVQLFRHIGSLIPIENETPKCV